MRTKHIAIITAATLTLSGGVATVNTITGHLEQARAQARARVVTADVQAAAIGTERELRTRGLQLLAHKRAQELADARTEFASAVNNADAAFKKAAGKVNVKTQAKALRAAKSAVSKAVTAAAVAEQTRRVDSLTRNVDKKITAYQAEQRRKAAEAERQRRAAQARRQASYNQPSPARASSVDDWFSEMRVMLNSVGGSWVPLVEYNGNCGGVTAAACSKSGVIMVNSSIASWTHSRKIWAMDHELAHQYQFRVRGTLMASPTYKSQFGSNIELLANCMTQTRGLNYSSQHCTSAQVSFASGIWAGRVG